MQKPARDTTSRILFFCLLVGAIVSLLGLGGRYRAETANQRSEIVLDGKALTEWRTELQDDTLLQRLLDARVASVAVHELVLDELAERGEVTTFSEQELELSLNSGAFGQESPEELQRLRAHNRKVWKDDTPGCYLLFHDEEQARSVSDSLRVTVGEVHSLLDGKLLWAPRTLRALKMLPLGFDGGQIRRLEKAGFAVWLRPQNVPGLNREQADRLFHQWSALPDDPATIHGVVFGGGANEALGYPEPDMLRYVAEKLAALGWRIGYIELSPKAQQDGIETMVRSAPGAVTRVLAVSAAHQAKLSADRVLGMYSLGARERNIRVLYVRPFAVPGRPELDQEFLFSLHQELPGGVGPAETFQEGSGAPGQVSVALIGLASAALALLILRSVGLAGPPAAWWALIVLAPLVGGPLSAAVGKYSLYRSLLALAVSVGVPCLAFLELVYPELTRQEPRANSLLAGVKLLGLVSLASLLAGLCVAALLPETTFLLGLDRFRGVKLLTLGTPVLVVVLMVVKSYSPQQLLAGLRTSILVYQALLVGLLGLVFAFLYLRTGNDAGGAASETERNFRVFLDRLLGVRPRFKEFLVAHPAMVCAPILARITGFLPSLVLVLLAAVGQAGIVDTFAHIHTPLNVTLVRVGLGVGFGLLFGALAWGLLVILQRVASKLFARYNIGTIV